jgi:hypothetical protein
MEPEARHLILCNQVLTDPDNFHRINILGLITSIGSTADPPFPVLCPTICALVILTEGRGAGQLVLRIFHERSGRIVFRSSPRRIRFVGRADAILGVVFRIRNCSFPEPGLYWVELVFAQSVVARQKLLLGP